jgi:hypothetical protein
MSVRFVVPMATLALAAALPSPASAAPTADPPAKVRVHVDTDLFGFTHYDPDDNDADGSNTNIVGFGLGRPTIIDGGRALFDRSVLGFGIGGLILQRRAVIGARVAFVVDGYLSGDDNDTAVGGRLVPYFNYMFGPFGRVRPYVGAHVGFGGGSITFEEDFGGAVTRSRVGVIYPIAGVQGGAHIFLVDRVSLDAGLSFDYLAPHSKVTQLEPPPDPAAPEDDFDKDGNVFNVAITLGLSAWF